jgi:CBS domain-containing protein
MRLKEIMNNDVEVVHPDDTLQTTARKMRERDIGFLPVCDGEHLVGVVSLGDLVNNGSEKMTSSVLHSVSPTSFDT